MSESGHLDRQLVLDAVRRLDHWLQDNGWAGYDPYDLPGMPILLAPETRTRRWLKRQASRMESCFPVVPRRLLRVPKAINAKAMGLFAEGYRQLFETTGHAPFLHRAQEALSWLEANPSPGYAGPCWGYPFDWQSRVLIPRGTPSSVVTATVGRAFWGFYRMTGERRYLDTCLGICEFFLKDLHIDDLDDGRICFSYTPVDRFHVHNANLFVADFLARIGRETGRSELLETGLRATAYALSEQNSDGSLFYWGRDQNPADRMDHYHSGFEIRCLHGIWKSTGDPDVRQALEAYYAFYKERLFDRSGIPKMTPTSLYPINIHSCAEAILCHSTLFRDFPEARDYLERSIPWILDHMQHPKGWFIYMIRRLKVGLEWKLAIPYIRWGQAWMLNAMAAFLEEFTEDETP